MTRDEIQRYLQTSSTKSVDVDVRSVFGVVRTVTLCKGWKVRVSYEDWGFDEAGAYFSGDFESLDAVLETLEPFLGTPLDQWENCTASGRYPDKPEEPKALVEAIRRRDPALIPDERFQLPGGWWLEQWQAGD